MFRSRKMVSKEALEDFKQYGRVFTKKFEMDMKFGFQKNKKNMGKKRGTRQKEKKRRNVPWKLSNSSEEVANDVRWSSSQLK